MKIYILILICVLVSCINKSENKTKQLTPIELIVNKLSEKDRPKPCFVLYVSEGMCAACINQELMNVAKDSIIFHNIHVLGSFSNQRYFNSFTNSIDESRKIFSNVILEKDLDIFYGIYEEGQKKISNIFHPEVCDPKRTFEYYETVKKYLN